MHRPKYDDWSLPKGKADPGESAEDCALREVEEETGLRCRLGDELPPSTYVDRQGRPKVVRWWAMTVVDGRAAAANEVDEVRWVRAEDAGDLLTYDRDVEVLVSFEAQVVPASQAADPARRRGRAG